MNTGARCIGPPPPSSSRRRPCGAASCRGCRRPPACPRRSPSGRRTRPGRARRRPAAGRRSPIGTCATPVKCSMLPGSLAGSGSSAHVLQPGARLLGQELAPRRGGLGGVVVGWRGTGPARRRVRWPWQGPTRFAPPPARLRRRRAGRPYHATTGCAPARDRRRAPRLARAATSCGQADDRARGRRVFCRPLRPYDYAPRPEPAGAAPTMHAVSRGRPRIVVAGRGAAPSGGHVASAGGGRSRRSAPRARARPSMPPPRCRGQGARGRARPPGLVGAEPLEALRAGEDAQAPAGRTATSEKPGPRSPPSLRN